MVDENDNVREDQISEFLTFKLGSEVYGIDISKVMEIIGLMEITRIPRTPSYIRGVINLRGAIHTVFDLKMKFAMGKTEVSEETCIIVVAIDKDDQVEHVGLLVDAVSEVIRVASRDIADAPGLGQEISSEFILGIAKTKNGEKIILDINNVINSK